MALQLYLGCSGSGKSYKLYKHIIEESLLHPEVTYLFIVPEQYNLSTQRRLISMHPKKGILNIDVISFTRLSHRVFEEVGYRSARGAVIDDIGKNLILRHMASGNEDKLTALSGVFTRLGYISEVKSVISEFMQYGIGDRELAQLIDKSGDRGILRAKLTDIRLLYSEFLKYINEKYITTEEILQKVTAAVPRSGKLKKSVIILDGYTGFTPVQLDLIEELLKNCIDVYLTVLLDTEECLKRSGIPSRTEQGAPGLSEGKGNERGTAAKETKADEQDLFYLSNKTLASIDRICRDNKIDRKADVVLAEETPARFIYDEYGNPLDVDKRSNELIHLERYLFRVRERAFDRKAYDPSANDDPGKTDGEAGENDTGKSRGSIRIFNGINPEEEAVEAAVRIERLIREKGYHYRDIAVVSGDLDTYMNACARAFTRYGIPFFIDKTRPVLLNPMIEYIRSLFDVMTDDFSYESVFRYLKTMVGDYSAEDIDALENYVLRYGIKGRKRWNEPFMRKSPKMKQEELEGLNLVRERIIGELDPFYEELMSCSCDTDFDGEAGVKDKTESAADRCGDGKTDEKGKKAITGASRFDVRHLSAALFTFIRAHRLSERMSALAEKMEKEGDPLRAKEFGRIYEEVCDLLDKMVRLLPGEAITIEEYAELLDAGFAEIRTGIIPPSDDYVQIGDITRTRLGDIKALFLMGVNDGIIPSAAANGGIISDMEREFLVSGGEGKNPDKDSEGTETKAEDTDKEKKEEHIELAPTARVQAYTQRMYLYMLLTRPSKELYISYAGLSRDGKALNPSYLVKTIMRMFPDIRTESPDEGMMNRAYNPDTAYDGLTEGIQDAVRAYGSTDFKEYASLLWVLSSEKAYRDRIGMMLETAFKEGSFNGSDEISRAVAKALYGTELVCSVTRLENYARCAYAHFLKYGLGLKERELFSFEAADMGSAFHDSLQSYAKILKEKNLRWQDVEEDERNKIIDEAVERCIAREDYSAVYGSFRTGYMVNRMRRIMIRTVDTLTEQLKKGSFEPYDFEFSFDGGNDFESLNINLTDDEKVRIIGRIDRMDICDGKNKIYVKIIDYKSGNKSFDLAGVYLGLDLQLVVYMNAACEYVRRRYKDKEPIPAGMLYYHIDDPYVTARDGHMSDEKIADEIAKQLKMKGLVNSDEEIYRLIDRDFSGASGIIPVNIKKDGGFGRGSSVADTEDFRVLSDYVKLKIGEAGQSILDGDIRPEPHMRSEKDISPCTYCEYHGICGYRGRGSVYGDELPEEQAADGYETDTNGDPAPSASGYPSDAGGGQNEDIIAAMRDYIKHKRQNDGEDND